MSFSFPRVSGRRAAVVGLAIGIAAGVALAGRTPPADPNAPREQDGQVVPPLDKAAADRIARRMDADGDLAASLSTCPADAWRHRGDLTRSARVAAATCAKAPDDCLANCLEFASGHACFSLARVVQRTKAMDPLYAEKLYHAACAAGDAAGCVNRAAGIRNGDYDGDPFRTRPADERQACEYRSFATGCDADDAWGCAMRGQAYAEGEGVPADATAARRDFAKACAKDPTFAACTFAKERRAEMWKPASADDAAPGGGTPKDGK